MKNIIVDNKDTVIQEQMSQNKQERKKKVKKVALILFVTFFILFVLVFSALPPIIMDDMVNMHVDFKKVYSAEEFGISSEKLTLKTEDGLNITGHEVYIKEPNAVIIFISGIHNPSVTAFFGHAKMLKENGYASILYEMRAHGESDGDVISLGYKEYLDTKAVVDYIKTSEKYIDVPIVVYGISMGGATAINSVGEIEEIDALISMSAYSSWEDVFCDNMNNMGMPSAITKIQKPFVRMYTTLKYGLDSFKIRPKDEIKKIGERPALIIHSTEDSQVPFSNFERIINNAPKHVESWTREGDLHGIVNNDNFEKPEEDIEYTERILSFLNKHFTKP